MQFLQSNTTDTTCNVTPRKVIGVRAQQVSCQEPKFTCKTTNVSV